MHCMITTCSCLKCQRTKVHQHICAPLGQFSLPGTQCQHVHIDLVGPWPISHGFTYILMYIDQFSCWPEAFPLADISAETVAKTFVWTWISRFGLPTRITTDCGWQFEVSLFYELSCILGTHHIQTISYHPTSNEMVECFHRQLKSSLRASYDPVLVRTLMFYWVAVLSLKLIWAILLPSFFMVLIWLFLALWLDWLRQRFLIHHQMLSSFNHISQICLLYLLDNKQFLCMSPWILTSGITFVYVMIQFEHPGKLLRKVLFVFFPEYLRHSK